MSLALLILAQSLPIAATPPPCQVLLVSKREGEAIFADEVSSAECPPSPVGSLLRFDRRGGMTLARTDLAVGQPLGHAYLPQRPAVLAGQAVRLSVTIGRASVSRQVVALQSAQVGQRYFVRAANGDVFAVPATPAKDSK